MPKPQGKIDVRKAGASWWAIMYYQSLFMEARNRTKNIITWNLKNRKRSQLKVAVKP